MRVLIADDDALSRRILEDALAGWGYEVTVTKNGEEAWNVLQQNEPPQLVILDWMMPVLDGVDICKMLRLQSKPRYTYVVLLTARNRPEDIVRGLEAGADDYIIKPFYPDELKNRLKIGERIISLEEHILRMARTDYLTGLLNRRAFMERMEGEISRAERENRGLGIVIADIDHFKEVNDCYGHQAGDQVLQEVARCLQRACRRYDFIGRYGGEEFIVGLPGADEDKTRLTAERIRTTIRQCRTILPERRGEVAVTVSLGVVALSPGQASSADELISVADTALYAAKNNGRDRVMTTEILPRPRPET